MRPKSWWMALFQLNLRTNVKRSNTSICVLFVLHILKCFLIRIFFVQKLAKEKKHQVSSKQHRQTGPHSYKWSTFIIPLRKQPEAEFQSWQDCENWIWLSKYIQKAQTTYCSISVETWLTFGQPVEQSTGHITEWWKTKLFCLWVHGS